LLVAPACSSKDIGVQWLPAQTAVVHCTVAGRHKMPPVLLSSPAPPPPSGLFARRLDPMALNDMGYERDLPVCAGLIVPETSRIDGAEAAVRGLITAADDAGRKARADLGRCVCDVAYDTGVRDMLPMCNGAAQRSGCETTDEHRATMEAAIAPLRTAVAELDLPRVHWRLAGKTDRPEWFAEKIRDLLGRHSGGATVFLLGEPVGQRHNHALVRRLLEVPGMQAVIREDGGQAVVTVRVVDSAMVIDLLAWPAFGAQYRGLLEAVDNAQPASVVAQLDKPATHWSPDLDPSKGGLVALDRAGLERMDDLAIAHARLAGFPYDRTAETWQPPAALVDRVTLQAPFGHEGVELDVDAQLSPEGVLWAAGRPEAPLSVDLSELSLAAEAPSFVAPPAADIELFLRGTAAASTGVFGLSRAGELMRRLELEYPGSIGGTTRAWEVDLPQGSIGFGGALDPGAGLESIADLIAAGPYTVKAELHATKLTARLRPE
jgi:hypothetical protein